MNELDIYVKPTDACKILGIGIHTLRSLAWDGVISTVKVGGKTMLYRDDVEKLANNPATVEKVEVKYKNTIIPKDPGKIYGLAGTSNSDVYK